MKNICAQMRKEILKHGYLSGRGHISSSLSMVELYAVLYIAPFFNIEKIKQNTPDRDRFVLSKGHGGLGLYIALEKAGLIAKNEIDGFATAKGRVAVHPVKDSLCGIEMTAGSLGQGIGFANGLALSAKMDGYNNKIVVAVGDGELQEGSNWEAMLFASQQCLDNQILIVDKNNLQITGRVDDISSLVPLKDKLEAFGYKTLEVEGHSVEAISEALNCESNGRPKAIIANTIKGKGVSFIENKNGWHGKGLTKEQYDTAISELEI